MPNPWSRAHKDHIKTYVDNGNTHTCTYIYKYEMKVYNTYIYI